MMDRYTDGLGTTYRSGEPEINGTSLVKHGYLMTTVRFLAEVLPRVWSHFWAEVWG
jgi:hypothetical protein